MSLLKRSFLSIIRNKTKSILLLLAVFVTVATFATSFNLYQTTTYIDKSIKASLDNYVFFDYIDNTYEDRGLDYFVRNGIDPSEYTKIESEMLSFFDDVKKLDSVMDANINSFRAGSDICLTYELDHPNIRFYIPYREITPAGVVYADDFMYDEIIEIVDGRMITQDDIDDHAKVAVIGTGYLHPNGEEVKVGDKIKISYTLTDNLVVVVASESYEFEVIGLNTEKSSFEKNWWQQSIGFPYIILPETTINDLYDKKELVSHYNLSERVALLSEYSYVPYYENVIFKMDSVDAFDEVISRFNNTQYLKKIYQIKTTADEYNQIKGPLINLHDMSYIALAVSTVVSLLILFLINYLYFRNKHYDAGILLSMGEDRKKIVLSFMIETTVIALIGTVLAIIVSSIISTNLMADIINGLIKYRSVFNLDDDLTVNILIALAALITAMIISLINIIMVIKTDVRELLR